MNTEIDRYLSTLLSFTPAQRGDSRMGEDYVSLIHVPVSGPEEIYSIVFGEHENLLTTARYRSALWETLDYETDDPLAEPAPSVDVVQAQVESTHPIIEFLGPDQLSGCENYSDGGPGMDYYLLMWQRDGLASVVECWEPYGRDSENWNTVIGAARVLASQYEHAAISGGDF